MQSFVRVCRWNRDEGYFYVNKIENCEFKGCDNIA